ncbi:MAG TPA: hypothetical protein VN193_12115 [Candidatus Angelobacter sp.]|nr:hypothetical protein [Candidatus Angelobacter sp.]
MVADLLPPPAHHVKAFGTLAAPSVADGAGRSPTRAGGVDAALRIAMSGDLRQYGGLNGRLLDVEQARSAVMASDQ